MRSQPTQPAPRIKPEFSTPPGKLLGHGQDCTGAKAHSDTLALRRRETPYVHTLVTLCHCRIPRTQLTNHADRLAAWVDVANARIACDEMGGVDNGNRDPSGLPLPALVEHRANAELCAKVCVRLAFGNAGGTVSEALAWIKNVCEEINA